MQFRYDKFLTICMFVVDLINGLSDELTKRTIADWQFDWRCSLDNSSYNSTYNSALQFGWPKWVKRSERPSSDFTVVQSGCLVPRPSLADVSRIGRSNGKGNPWALSFHTSWDIQLAYSTTPHGQSAPDRKGTRWAAACLLLAKPRCHLSSRNKQVINSCESNAVPAL